MATIDRFDLTGFSEAASSIDHTMNWDDVTQYRAESDRDGDEEYDGKRW